MNAKELKPIIESLLFARGDEGLTLKDLVNTLSLSEKQVLKAIEKLKEDYENETRGIHIMQTEDTYYLVTKPQYSTYFQKMMKKPQPYRLSQAALEVLAIIAYKQPITRVEIEEIRGVNSHRPIQTLLSYSFIEEVGRKDCIGRPILFGTTTDFLTFFGLTSLEELPPLQEDLSTAEDLQEADLYFDRFHEIDEKSNH